MYPYWLLFSMFTLGAVTRPARGRAFIFTVATCLTALFIGLRFQTGGDWANYREIYIAISHLGFADALTFTDPAYALLNYIAAATGAGIWLVNLACAVAFTWGIAVFARAQADPWLACIVAVPYLIIVVALGYTRQSAALGFIMAAFAAFLDRKLPRMLLLSFIAVLFHKSAIAIVPLALLAWPHNRVIITLIVLIGGGLGAFVLLGEEVQSVVDIYSQQQIDSQGAAIRVAMNAVPAFLFMLFRRRISTDELDWKLWRNVSIAALLAVPALVVAPSTTVVDRLALYLIPIQLVVFSRLPFIIRGTSSGPSVLIAFLVVVYSAAIQFVWLNYSPFAEFWIPYKVYQPGYNPEFEY